MDKKLNVLVVDDQVVFSDTLKESLQSLGYNVEQAFTGETALDIIHERRINLIFLDVFLPDISGFDLIKKIQSEIPGVEIIIMTAYSQSDFVKRSVEHGSYFLPKPFRIEDLTTILNKIESKAFPLKEPDTGLSPSESMHFHLESTVKAVSNAIELADKYSDSSFPVLIHGEQGTGRQTIAEYIHNNSKRNSNNFITVNSDDLPDDIIEFHLFGYEKNAFKGAIKRKIGIIESAEGGTLFIEDFNKLPCRVQQELLRIIESKHLRRIGGGDEIGFDVRFIVSTTLSLADAKDNENCNLALFNKLNTLSLDMPPLRRRKKDIMDLITGILQKFNIDIDDFHIDSSAESIIKKYNWPGNIFELEDIVTRLILMSNGEGIFVDNLPIKLIAYEGGQIKKDYTLKDIERRHILNTLIKVDGNKAKAARILGIDRKTLYRKIEKYELNEYK
ncbi:MAG: sigma-54 dependent transcriptional regulator [candidate division WOR-3 bacterium]|nr:sigma-54 dependent transcriptional regulator [candidate division WOR-3 bacterium]